MCPALFLDGVVLIKNIYRREAIFDHDDFRPRTNLTSEVRNCGPYSQQRPGLELVPVLGLDWASRIQLQLIEVEIIVVMDKGADNVILHKIKLRTTGGRGSTNLSWLL